MSDTRFVDPTGLSPATFRPRSDLAQLVRAAHGYPLIREYSTRDKRDRAALGQADAALPQHQRPGAQRALGHRPVQDRLHQRSGALPGDAGAHRLEGPDRGAARFVGQALARRRRQPHQEVARDHARAARDRPARARSTAAASGEDVIAGLSLPQKALPPKYFYDARGQPPVRAHLPAARVLPDAHRARAHARAPRRDRALRRQRRAC